MEPTTIFRAAFPDICFCSISFLHEKTSPAACWKVQGKFLLLLFLCLDGRVNGAGSFLAGTHGQNNRGSTGNGIAAGVDHRAARQAVGAVRDQAAMLVGVQTRRGGADQRVGAGTQCHDHRINVQNEPDGSAGRRERLGQGYDLR